MSDNFNNDSEKENFLFGKNKEFPFTLPEGYFDVFASQLINKIELQEELEEFKVIAAIDKKAVFTVPENYFSSTENLLEHQSELAAFTELSKISKPVFAPLQQQYADALDEKVLKQAEIAEELREYKTLFAIDKQNNFAVSPEYFDSVADDVKERLYSSKTQSVSIFEQIIQFIFRPKIAFALSFVLIVGVGSVLYFNHDTHVTMVQGSSGDCKTLACLEKNELLNEKNVRDFDEDNLYEMVDVDQLNKQISNKTASDSLSQSGKNHSDSIHK